MYTNTYIQTYIRTYEIISKLYSEKHCRQWKHYEVKSGEAYFSVSPQRKTVQRTPKRKQVAWNIYRFCQKFVLSMAQTYRPSLLVTHKTQISHQQPGHMWDLQDGVPLLQPWPAFCSCHRGRTWCWSEGKPLALAGFVALPLVKVGGSGLESISSKHVLSCLIDTEESAEQT